MGDRRGERGQIIIIAALVIAATFVGLALVLNSGIYAENLSSRQTTDSAEAMSAIGDGFDETEAMLDRANANHNDSHEDANRNLTAMVDGRSDRTAREHASLGSDVEMTINDRTNGTYIRQTNDSRNFTDASGSDTNWTLADDVGAVSDYRMVVNRDDLDEDDDGSFSLNVSNGTATWELHVYEDDADDDVVVKPIVDGNEQSPCEVDAAEVEIDLVAGTVGGDPCPTLTFAEGLEGEIDLEYRDPDQISGTYELRIDDTIDPASDSRYEEWGAGSPSATPNVYSTTVRIDYRRTGLSAGSTRRLVAGEEIYRA